MKTNVFIVVVNIILGYFLALQMGAVGVVYATVFSEFLRYISHAWFLTKTQKITLVPKTLRNQFLSGIVMYLVVELIRPKISVDSWIQLLLILVLGGITYFSVLSIISPKFRETAIPLIKKMSP
jgi:peptidoglycan biosynthesis protein MviN/MurJ (putative lipid II flippase)